MFGSKKNEKYVMSLMKLREIKKGIGCNGKFNSVFKNTESSTSTSETSGKLSLFFLYSRFFPLEYQECVDTCRISLIQ